MKEARPTEASEDTPSEDVSSEVAGTQAPAHLEERGLDDELEGKLDARTEDGSD